MTNILVFGMTENPGGVESFLMNYLRHIDCGRFHFDFLCNSYDPIAYEDELSAMGFQMFHFISRRRDPARYRKELGSFFREHAKDYDVIWVNVNSLANIDYLKLAKRYGIPKRIIHSHNAQNMDSGIVGQGRKVLHMINRTIIDRYATDFWACSEDAADWFYRKAIRNRAVVIRNAIDVNRMQFHETDRERVRQEFGLEKAYVLTCIGRLHFQKNQAFALSVLKQVSGSLPQARLLLVGQGEDEEMLRKRTEELGLEGKVIFTGIRSDIPAVLSASDLFLFPSVFEGMPIAPLEAQANGLPVIASAGVMPRELQILPSCRFCSLRRPADEWARMILQVRNHFDRTPFPVVKEKFSAAGYDVETEVSRLERLLSEKR